MTSKTLLERARAAGTDKQYREWIKRQRSCISGAYSEYHPDTGDGFCVGAHIRHVSRGAGTATKPEYSCVPVTDAEHRIMHSQGDSHYFTKAAWDKIADKYLEKWIAIRRRRK